MPTYQNKGDYLLVEISEPYSLNLFLSTIHEVADQCREENLNKVLLDVRNMTGNPSIFDRFQIGIEIVRYWGPKLKAAGIAKSQITNRMMENTAINRGSRVKAFSKVNEALAWLGVSTNIHETTGD